MDGTVSILLLISNGRYNKLPSILYRGIARGYISDRLPHGSISAAYIDAKVVKLPQWDMAIHGHAAR